MKTLNEEINKIKHLFNYKKGDVITENVSHKNDLDKIHIFESEELKQEIDLKKYGREGNDYRIKGFIPFDVTKSDLAVQELINNINDKIKGAGISSKGIKTLKVTGGASNYLNGPMKADKLNHPNNKNFYTNPKNDLPEEQYTGEKNRETNKGYATKRAQVVQKALEKTYGKLEGYSPSIESFIIDTGGKVDKDRDESVYPIPGQHATFEMIISAKKPESKVTASSIFKQTQSGRSPAGDSDNPKPQDGYGIDEVTNKCAILAKNAKFILKTKLPEYGLDPFIAKFENNQIVRKDKSGDFTKPQWMWIKWYLTNDQNKWNCDIFKHITNLPDYFDRIDLENLNFGAMDAEHEFVHDKSKHDIASK